MEYTAQFTYDCVWLVDGEKRVCTGGHESDGYPCYMFLISANQDNNFNFLEFEQVKSVLHVRIPGNTRLLHANELRITCNDARTYTS